MPKLCSGMPVDDGDAYRRRLEHARWRVNFLRSLLESHRMMDCRWKGPDWEERLQADALKLEAAENELKRVEAELVA
jgi:hypothetical protein